MFYLLHCFSRRPPHTQQETLKVVCDRQPVSETQLCWAEWEGCTACRFVSGFESQGNRVCGQWEEYAGGRCEKVSLFHLEQLRSQLCCHCNITYKTRAQSLMSLTLKIWESLSCLRVLVMCSECAVLFPKAFHLKVSFRQLVWDGALWSSMAKEQDCVPFNFNKSWEKILFSLAEFILSDLQP